MTDRSQPLVKWEHPIALVAALAAVAAVVVASIALVGQGKEDDRGGNATTTAATSTTVPDTRRGDGSPDATTSVAAISSSTGMGDTMLGRDVVATEKAPCRPPSVAAGSSWNFGPVTFHGTSIEAYSCNVQSGNVGSLRFDLKQQYVVLVARAGFADGSTGSLAVNVEVLGDGETRKTYVVTPTSDQAISVDVAGVRDLEVRFVESHEVAGSESPSQFFVGDALLT